MKRILAIGQILVMLVVLTGAATAGDSILIVKLDKKDFTALQATGDTVIPDLLAVIRTTDPAKATDPEERTRLWSRKGRAVFALGHIGTPKALTEIRKLLEQPEGTPQERRFCKQTALEALTVMVLRNTERAGALQLAQQALADPDVMLDAMEQLGDMGDRSSVNRIHAIYERASDPSVKREAALALAKLGDTSVLPYFFQQIDSRLHEVPGGIFFDSRGYKALSYLAPYDARARDRLRGDLLKYAPAFGTNQGLFHVHFAAQGLLRADALTVDLLVKVLTRPTDYKGVRYALDGLRHTHEAARMRRLLDEAVKTPEVQAAWSKFGSDQYAYLQQEAAKPMQGPEMGRYLQ